MILKRQHVHNLSGIVIKYSSDVLDVVYLSCIMHLQVYNHLISVKVLRSSVSTPKSIAFKTSERCQQ